MSGVVPASSEDWSNVLNSVEEPKGSWRIFTWMFGLAFMKRATPLVRKDWEAGMPWEPAANGSFQIVMFVTLALAPAATDTSDAPSITELASSEATSLRRWFDLSRPS